MSPLSCPKYGEVNRLHIGAKITSVSICVLGEDICDYIYFCELLCVARGGLGWIGDKECRLRRVCCMCLCVSAR